MIISLAGWLENLGLFAFIRSNGYAYPILLALHLTFISFFGVMILVTDIRLLGWGLRSQPVSDIIDQLRWPKRIGFLFVATMGFLLFGAKAEEYLHNRFFQLKLLLFTAIAIHALVFRPRVYNNANELDGAKSIPGQAKLAGAVSIFLWVSVACAGRGIGYLAAPFGLHYDRTVGVSAPAADIVAVHNTAVHNIGGERQEAQVARGNGHAH